MYAQMHSNRFYVVFLNIGLNTSTMSVDVVDCHSAIAYAHTHAYCLGYFLNWSVTHTLGIVIPNSQSSTGNPRFNIHEV